MLYLAEVQTSGVEGKLTLHILAQQASDYVWIRLPEPEAVTVTLPDSTCYNEGVLVLVDLLSNRQIRKIESASSFVLTVIDEYLSFGFSPKLMAQEVQRAEQWRQSLTLQSQELGRRSLEMEARRDQIQMLEENLKREKKELEAFALEIEARQDQLQQTEARLNQERQSLEKKAEDLQLKQQRLQEQEECILREKKQLEQEHGQFKLHLGTLHDTNDNNMKGTI